MNRRAGLLNVACWLTSFLLFCDVPPAFAVLIQHGMSPDETHRVTGGGVIWTATSNLRINTPEPHISGIEGTHKFTSRHVFNIASPTSPSNTQALLVPGLHSGPVAIPSGGSLADTNFTVVWRIAEGPGIFDYEQPWSLDVFVNRFLPTVTTTNVATVGATITSGPVGVNITGSLSGSLAYTPPEETGGVIFTTDGDTKTFTLTLNTTNRLQQSFFDSGGRIDLIGGVKDKGEGTTRILYDNVYWPALQVPVPDQPGRFNFIWADTDSGQPSLLQTQVYDDFISEVPEPSTLLLLGSSLAGLGGYAWRRRRN